MIHPKKMFELGKKAVMAWVDDFAPSMGAAISYYTMFSLAPLLIIVIAIAGAIFGAEAVQGQIAAQLSGLIGQEGAEAVQGLIKSADEPSRGLVAGIISIGVLIVGATTVFAELQSALDRIWHVPEKVKPSGVWGILRARVLSFGLILGLAFLLMVSLSVSAGVAAFGNFTSGLMPGWEVVLQVVNIAIALAIETLLFAMIFKLMPTVPIAWRDVWVGAFATGVLFEVGKLAIGLYIGKSGVASGFGAAGSLVVLLAWVYYAAQIFLLGAEFTKVYADDRGSASGQKAVSAQKVATATAEAGSDVHEAPALAAAGLASQSVTDQSVRPLQEDVERRTHAALAVLARQVVFLAATTLVTGLVSKRQRQLRKSSKSGRK